MEEKGKKVKIEISKLTLVFLILFSLCILIWTFIFGAWIGSKIGGKGEKMEIATERLQPSTISNLTSSNVSQTNVTVASSNLISSNFTSNATINSNVTQFSMNAQVEHKPEKVIKKEPTKYQKKEVAQIASSIKKEDVKKTSQPSQASYYTLQVGAFSSINSVEAFKETLTKKGYHPLVEKVTVEGKTWYRVYVGKYSSKEEAQKHVIEVKNKLGLDKVLVVELK